MKPETTVLPADVRQTAHIDGLALTYARLDAPSSPHHPVLLLHGWGVNAALMLTTARSLQQAGISAIVPDLPGFGLSDPPPVTWLVGDYAKLVVRLLDQLGLEQVGLIGHSFGGRLGLILGSDHAARFSRMVLTSAAGVPPRRPLLPTLRLRTYKALRSAITSLGARGLSERMSAWYNRRYGSADFQQTSGVMRETFKQVIAADLRPFAARVSIPTLLIWGDADNDTPLWMGQTLEKLIPDAGLVVFSGAGHYAYLERHAEFIRVAAHFFTH